MRESRNIRLEDGHFELNEEADQTLLAAIATGEKADVKQYYTGKAKRELDEKFDGEFEDKFKENSTASSRRNLTANSMRNFRHSSTRHLRRR